MFGMGARLLLLSACEPLFAPPPQRFESVRAAVEAVPTQGVGEKVEGSGAVWFFFFLVDL